MRAVHIVRRNGARLAAILVITGLYLLARQPSISRAERQELAGRFRFHQLQLAEPPGGPAPKRIRSVHLSLQRISGWVSATGAGVALNDMDGDGLPNDLCAVDPRTDRVTVAPAPGTPPRYQPFALDAGPLFEPSRMAPMGCLPADLNEDGAMDLLVYYWGRTPIAYLAKGAHGPGASRLSADGFLPQEVITGGERWYTGAATLADLDGDAHLDLVIGNYYADQARILDAKAGGRERMQHSMTRAYNAGRSRLLRWADARKGSDPSVRYEEVRDYVTGTAEEREALTHGWALAVAAADLDGDLLPELYFANDFGPDRLLLNLSEPGRLRFTPLKGVKTLTTPNSKVLGRDGFKGMGVDFADIDNDGLTDIYVSNISAEYSLEESHFAFINTGMTELMRSGVAPFVDHSESLGLSRSGWAWEAKLADFDNDGVLEALQATGFARGEVNCWPELHELAMANDQLLERPGVWFQMNGRCGLSDRGHNPFFVRARDGRYYDVAAELGLDQTQISRGIAVADVDGDGRLDYAVANQWEPSYFYRNESPRAGRFLGLRLRLPVEDKAGAPTRVRPGNDTSGRPTLAAVGARAEVRLPEGRRLIAEVDGGNGHSGKRAPDLHFGLGASPGDAKLEVEVRWRDRRRGGTVNRKTLELSPGWYTITLGGEGGTKEN